eukprot:4548106-Amphidinium_carterae.1
MSIIQEQSKSLRHSITNALRSKLMRSEGDRSQASVQQALTLCMLYRVAFLLPVFGCGGHMFNAKMTNSFANAKTKLLVCASKPILSMSSKNCFISGSWPELFRCLPKPILSLALLPITAEVKTQLFNCTLGLLLESLHLLHLLRILHELVHLSL